MTAFNVEMFLANMKAIDPTLRAKSRKIGNLQYALPDWKILTAMFQRNRPRKWLKPTQRKNETFSSRTSLKSKLEILNEL